MIRSLLLLLVTAFLFSCNKPTGIKDHVAVADSVAINYYKGDGTMDTVTKVILLRNADQLQQLASYIESGQVKETRCGYDGSIHFFKKDMVMQDVDFRMNDAQCMHFSFVLGDRIYSTKLSAEAKQFLESVKGGR